MKNKPALSVLDEKLGICRFDRGADLPGWALKDGFFSVTGTHEELSVVCLERNIPEGVKCERGWRSLKVEGPLDFSLTGILAAISTVLANVGISIFAVSTYDTDYILVKECSLEKTVEALRNDGFSVSG